MMNWVNFSKLEGLVLVRLMIILFSSYLQTKEISVIIQLFN